MKPIDPAMLVREYYARRPDPADPAQRVSFGTSGHRGHAARRHLHRGAHPGHHAGHLRVPPASRASTARCSWARTRTPSRRPPQRTALEVLAANGVERLIQRDDGFTPTPVDLARHPGLQPRPHARPRRRHRDHALAQPAGRRRLQVQPAERRPGRHRHHRLDPEPRQRAARATESRGVEAHPASSGARGRDHARGTTSSTPYVARPAPVRRSWTPSAARGRHASASIRSAGRRVGYWEPIAERYGLDLTVVNPSVDPTFRFMPRRPRRQDPHGLLVARTPWPAWSGCKDRFDVAFGNDPDADRHGIVTPSAGLMNPNHYLAVAIHYLLDAPAAAGRRRRDRQDARVSSSMIDRVVAALGRRLVEVPVGLQVVRRRAVRRLLGFGGEESAGAASCGATARSGPPTRTGIMRPPGGGDHGGDRPGPRRALCAS